MKSEESALIFCLSEIVKGDVKIEFVDKEVNVVVLVVFVCFFTISIIIIILGNVL